MESAQSMDLGNGSRLPETDLVRRACCDQLHLHSIGIVESEHLLTEALLDRQGRNAVSLQVILPEAQRTGRDVVRHRSRLSVAAHTAFHIRPGEEGQDTARGPNLIREIEMIGLRCIEVNGLLHQPLTEDIAVKIHISLCVACYGCDMVQTFNWFHALSFYL